VSNFYFVKGDDLPAIEVTLTRDVTGDVINTTGSTVVFKYRRKGALSTLGTLSDVSTTTQKTNGIAIFQFGLTDLDVDAGNYEAEVEITNSAGRVETVYEIIDFTLREDF